MGRVLAIDYGTKRVGLAVSDPLKLIANRLDTIRTYNIFEFLKEYLSKEVVDCFVVGFPKRLDNEPSEAQKYVSIFLKQLSKLFPEIPVYLMDERFTSKIAARSMIEAGLKKKDRQNKALIDSISATILLQNYLDLIKNK